MPDPNLQSYIASHYLSGPKADAILARSSDGKLKRKKKKPKTESTHASSTGIVIKDDADSWKVAFGDDEDEDGLMPQIVNQADGGPSKAFRKISSSGKIIPDDADVKEESSAAVEEQTAFKAGLRSKEEMKAARLAREERRKREAEAEASASTSTSQAAVGKGGDEKDEEARLAQETIYRDSSGRIIDIKAQEAHDKALERERQLKEAERKTWSQGLVQKQQKRQAEEQLASIRDKPISRKATDEEYNRHFKEQERADDPALAFMTKKREKGPQKPKYKGPWPPNRFNIPPGYRWDGVDRGNGFERALIERKAVLENREREARAWGQADM